MTKFEKMKRLRVRQGHFFHLQIDFTGQSITASRTQEVKTIKRKIFANLFCQVFVPCDQALPHLRKYMHGRTQVITPGSGCAQSSNRDIHRSKRTRLGN
jgi:hypothetical protein